MDTYNLGEMEQKLAEILWSNCPITTKELVNICNNEFSWARTTTYTMLKRLCDRGLFSSNNSVINIEMSRDDYLINKGDHFIKDSFSGSVPLFISMFSRKGKLTEDEIDSIQSIIDEYRRNHD